jgi:hypothetical protein
VITFVGSFVFKKKNIKGFFTFPYIISIITIFMSVALPINDFIKSFGEITGTILILLSLLSVFFAIKKYPKNT